MWLRKLKEVNMKFRDLQTNLIELKKTDEEDSNSYMIVSKADTVSDLDMQNVIQIIGETGEELTCTYDKFVEIFDEKGLSGFIM